MNHHPVLSKYRAAFLGLALVVFTALSLAPVQAEAALSVPVKAKNFDGTLNIVSFAAQDNKLVAMGSLTGTVKDANNTVQSVAIGNVVIPAAIVSGATGGAKVAVLATCPILHLELGPIFLDLLGLQVSLNEVILDITAVPGAGNLLGNLLCAVAGLLDPNSLGALVDLLNDILALLG
jgi:hypothetical protein